MNVNNKRLSKCCNAKVKVVMSPDFFGDKIKVMKIGICFYVCLKCNNACDIHQKK